MAVGLDGVHGACAEAVVDWDERRNSELVRTRGRGTGGGIAMDLQSSLEAVTQDENVQVSFYTIHVDAENKYINAGDLYYLERCCKFFSLVWYNYFLFVFKMQRTV